MAYTVKNYKTKKAIREDLAAGVVIRVYEPGVGHVPENGEVFLEGPHYPAAHTWYGEGILKDGKLVSFK